MAKEARNVDTARIIEGLLVRFDDIREELPSCPPSRPTTPQPSHLIPQTAVPLPSAIISIPSSCRYHIEGS